MCRRFVLDGGCFRLLTDTGIVNMKTVLGSLSRESVSRELFTDPNVTASPNPSNHRALHERFGFIDS